MAGPPEASPGDVARSVDDFADALVVVAASGEVVAWSRGAERLFGLPGAGAVGRPFDEVLPLVDREEDPDVWRAASAAGEVVAFETTRARADGAAIVLDATARAVAAPPGAAPSIALCLKDVTRRKHLREAVVLEARYRGLLEAAPDAMVIVNRAGRVVLANSQTLRLFGYARDELLGQPVEVLVPEAARARHPEWRRGYFAAPRARAMGADIELAGRRKDGSEFPAEISLSPMEADEGILVSAAVRDVTERKLMERRRALELEEQHRRIAEASRLKSEFLANMSHELRTPLNAIIGFAKLMHGGTVGPVAPDHREYLGDIITSAEHLLRLINDVLDLSRVEAGKLELRPEPLELDRVVGEVCEVLRTIAATKHIRVERALDPDVREVVADPGRLKQVLYNYLSNALKFTPEGGRVVVRSRPDGPDRFRLEVEDTGPGISPADQDRLFVEFQQLDASAAKRHQGTGLGLALTRRLAAAQGGAVGLSSALGRGSTFWVVLPRDARAALPATAARPVARGRAGPAWAPRVLVVEDDAREQAALARALEAAGYAVEPAATGAEALALGRARRFDAITLDLVLPDTTGWELLRALREGGPNVATPVVVVTVVGEACAAFPVHDYLLKPVGAQDLVASLERAGVRAGAGRPVVLVDGDPAGLRATEAALRAAGFSTVAGADAGRALVALADAPPAALVVDLRGASGAGPSGAALLARARAGPGPRTTRP